MHIFVGEHMYVIDDREIRNRGLEMLQILVDIGKVTHEAFLKEFERRAQKETDDAVAQG
jgi:hypothetical protein